MDENRCWITHKSWNDGSTEVFGKDRLDELSWYNQISLGEVDCKDDKCQSQYDHYQKFVKEWYEREDRLDLFP